MLRKIVDYKKLSHEVALQLIESYPDGYGDSDIIQFKNMHGEIIEAVEVRTDDILYLVKISKSLSNFIANFDDLMEKELESKITPEEGEDTPKAIDLVLENEYDTNEEYD
ncbi:MAG: hypothetical protein NWQ38_10190 [Cellulophaga sp.]|nr:hypothetical protein [Cellulophaga sp.]